jgi:hypothetical protein
MMSQREFQSQNDAATFTQKRIRHPADWNDSASSFCAPRLFSVEKHIHFAYMLWIKKSLLLNVTWRQKHRAPPTEWYLFLSDEKKVSAALGVWPDDS